MLSRCTRGVNKTMSLIMEVFHRLRNCSGQIPTTATMTILEKFILKLKHSGYNHSTRKNIILSGVTYYYHRLRIELQGGPAINKRNEKIRPRKMNTKDWIDRKLV